MKLGKTHLDLEGNRSESAEERTNSILVHNLPLDIPAAGVAGVGEFNVCKESYIKGILR